MSDTNTLGYVMITIIGTLFFVGTGSIITSIFIELPPPVPYRRPEPKVIIDASILSGIDAVNDSIGGSLNSNILEIE